MLDFQTLYETYAEEIYRFAFWLCGDRFAAEDVTSETLLRAWIRFERVRTETLKGYLLTIARNYYLEQKRKDRRHVALADRHVDPSPSPAQAAETKLELEKIRNSLRNIPEMERTAFLLRVLHGLPYSEIGQILGISQMAARVKVHRIRRKLLDVCMREGE